jgi:hypothetical protein
LKAPLVVAAIILICAGLTPLAQADTFEYLVFTPATGGPYPCQPAGEYTVFGIFNFDTPARSVELRAPLPACQFTTITGTAIYPAVGDLETGIVIEFDSCLTGSNVVFYYNSGTNHDCAWGCVEGPGGPGTLPVVTGCDGVAREITADLSCPGANPPADLLPAAGATGVSLDPTLSWTWDWTSTCQGGLGIVIYGVYLGTDPANIPLEQWIHDWDQKWLDVGTLEPDTEYFWYVTSWDDAWVYPGSHSSQSPVQSFTTGPVVPTHQATWGAIKSLYKH